MKFSEIKIAAFFRHDSCVFFKTFPGTTAVNMSTGEVVAIPPDAEVTPLHGYRMVRRHKMELEGN